MTVVSPRGSSELSQDREISILVFVSTGNVVNEVTLLSKYPWKLSCVHCAEKFDRKSQGDCYHCDILFRIIEKLRSIKSSTMFLRERE